MSKTYAGLRRRTAHRQLTTPFRGVNAITSLVTEIAELRDDAQLIQLLRDSVDGNVATIFSAIRHAIPIEKVELPTAALEHARRLAQRGVTVNALVRAYRLGHKMVLDAVLDEIAASKLEPPLSLAVFSQISEITFGYVDWITQQVVTTYQNEHDRWMENRKQPARVTGPGAARRGRPRHRCGDDRDPLSASADPPGGRGLAR